MNRFLVVPAGCSLLAFATLVAVFHGAVRRATFAEGTQLRTPWRRVDHGTLHVTRVGSASQTALVNDNLLLSIEDAEQSLTTLAGEYLRPWRQWESSPRHLYSRAAPRPIPTMYASIAMSPSTVGQCDRFLVTAIAVGNDAHSQVIPCVIDRVTRRIGLFADEDWLTEDEWLKKAPLPHLLKH